MNIPVQKGLPIPLLDNGSCGSPCGRTGTGLSMLPVIWCGVVMEGARVPSIIRTDTPHWVPACPPEVAGGGSTPLQACCIPGTTRNLGNAVPARVRRNFPLSGRACPGFFPFDGDHTKETAGTGRASSLPAGFLFLILTPIYRREALPGRYDIHATAPVPVRAGHSRALVERTYQEF